jgi:hypothetical protein
VTYSDLLYLCALIAVIAGVSIVALAFLGALAAVGIGLVCVAGGLALSARTIDRNSS